MVSTNFMFKKHDLLKFDDVHKLFLLKFIHFIYYTKPSIFISHFSNLLPNHHYPTRNILINLPQTRLQIEKNFTIFQVCKFLNNLNSSFLEPQSMSSLNKNFKRYCISNY